MTASTLTEADRAEILERYRKGQTTHQLARRFDVSHMAILRALKDEPRRPAGFQPDPSVSTDWIIELREDSRLTWAEIGKVTGLSLTGARKRYLTARRPSG